MPSNLKGLEIEFQVILHEKVLSTLWSTVRDRNVIPSCLEGPLALFEHNGYIKCVTFAAQHGVDGGFVYYEVELFVLIFEISAVHRFKSHTGPLIFVPRVHLVYTDS